MSLTVDLHHHVIPEFYWQASNEDGNAAGGINPPRWSLDGAIAYLDEAGIDVAVPSISTPGVHFGDDAAARTLARQVNEYLAGLKHNRPDRFGAFAVLPLPDVDGSLEQIAYAFDVLELDGVSVFTNAGGSYLGDSRFDAIFTELQRRAAFVFVHPTASPDPIAHTLGIPDTLLDYPVDTSRAIAKLHYSNTFARTPDVKYQFVHAGGTIPFLAERFAIVDEMNVIPGRRSEGRLPMSFVASTGTPPRRSVTRCSTCCDRSRGSEMSCSGPIIRTPATQSPSAACVSFRTPLSLTTMSGAPS
jgi:aminocarboxymuconate-semialdehyde decarboxylase